MPISSNAQLVLSLVRGAILVLAGFLPGAPLAGDPGPEASRIDVPRGAGITLDGRLAEKEWSDAHRVELEGGGLVFLKHDGSTLNVGIRGVKPGYPTLFFLRGEEIELLHASAALGTATYRRKEQGWSPVREFTWQVRETGDDPEALAARRKFLEDSGWVGSTVGMGEPLETEIIVRLDWAGAGGVKLAVAWLAIDEPMAAYWWPADLGDDVRRIRLLQGYCDDALTFRPAAWPIFNLQDAPR